jgi:hypothetical protein
MFTLALPEWKDRFQGLYERIAITAAKEAAAT